MGGVIAVVGHVLNPAVRGMFERVRRERPLDHDVRMILSNDDPAADTAGLAEVDVDRIGRDQLFKLPYGEKCRPEGFEMAGNLDLVFLEFARRHPEHDQYWFIEYDVHWEGRWSVFFEHFRSSRADVLAATLQSLEEASHKFDPSLYPRYSAPEHLHWTLAGLVKGFLPICRLSKRMLAALDGAYRAGLCGHYEWIVPSVAAQSGMELEDFGGSSRWVRPENLNRFYFARGSAHTHSPGNFVFRPVQRVLPRENTLWHPVKPDGVPAWHPLRMTGSPVKTLWERVKPLIGRRIIWLWFATRWRPLKGAESKEAEVSG